MADRHAAVEGYRGRDKVFVSGKWGGDDRPSEALVQPEGLQDGLEAWLAVQGTE